MTGFLTQGNIFRVSVDYELPGQALNASFAMVQKVMGCGAQEGKNRSLRVKTVINRP